MSWYTVFDQQEPLLTSTTTAAALQSTDAVLVHSTVTLKKAQSTVGAISAQLAASSATTLTSGTNISPYGVTTCTFAPATALTSFAWLLSDPPVTGLTKEIIGSTTTSSQNTINAVSATIKSSSGTSQGSVSFGIAAAALTGIPSIFLTAQSTSVWVVTARTAGATFSS